MSTNPVKIGPTTLRCPVLIAPMSGVSDRPFRDLCHDLGAGLVVSEMIASEELVRERASVVRRATVGTARPFVMQLAGREARWMAEGARMAADLGADIIDINMGCPAREVTGKLSGSALMRDLDHAESLIRAVTGAVSTPVTLKMRLGWDHANLNAARTRVAGRGGEREARHRARTHPLPILQGRGRLGPRRRHQARG